MKAYECKDKVYLYVSSMRIKKLQIKLNSNHYPWSEAQKDVAKKKKKTFSIVYKRNFSNFCRYHISYPWLDWGKKNLYENFAKFMKIPFFFPWAFKVFI